MEPTQVAEVASKIQAMNENKPNKPIYNVKYGKGTVEKIFFQVTQIVRNVGLVLVVCLALTAMFFDCQHD